MPFFQTLAMSSKSFDGSLGSEKKRTTVVWTREPLSDLFSLGGAPCRAHGDTDSSI